MSGIGFHISVVGACGVDDVGGDVGIGGVSGVVFILVWLVCI